MKRIYIIGQARGVYRTQNFIKYILDRKDYKIYYNDFRFDNKVIDILSIMLHSFFISPFIILQSDIVYVASLNVGIHIIYEMLIARLFAKKVIYEYYVSVYDTVILDRKMFKANSIFASLTKLYDVFAINLSTKTIFLNKTELKRYTSLLNVNSDDEKYVIIPLCIEEKKKVEKMLQDNRENVTNICWWGSYLPLHGLEAMIKAIKILKEKDLNVYFYIFGDSDLKSKPFKSFINNYGLEDRVIINNEYSFSNGKLEEFLVKNCDIALGTFGDSEKAKNVITNKLLDACSMKSIIITGYNNAVSEYFTGTNDIFMCDNTPQMIATRIEAIMEMDKSEIQNCINRSFNIYKEHFSVQAFKQNLDNLFYRL